MHNRIQNAAIQNSLNISAAELAQVQAQAAYESQAMRARAKQSVLDTFKDIYRQVRASNLALNHEAAMELTRNIINESHKITYDDISTE